LSDYYRRILRAELEKDIWFLHRSIELALQVNAEPVPAGIRQANGEDSEFNRIPALETAAEGGSVSQFYHYGHATVQLSTFSEGSSRKNKGCLHLQFVSSVKASKPTDRLVEQVATAFPQLEELPAWRPVHLRDIQEKP